MAGVVAVAGVGTLNTTPNVASHKIILKPRDAHGLVGPIIERLTKVANAVPGIPVYFQSVPDARIATRASLRSLDIGLSAPTRPRSTNDRSGS